MKTKGEILGKLLLFTKDLTGQNLALANVAMVETEIWIDIRDILERGSMGIRADISSMIIAGLNLSKK